MEFRTFVSISKVIWNQLLPSTVQPKNNARARTSFCVRKPATSCGFLRVACAWILRDARTSLRIEVKTARTSSEESFFKLVRAFHRVVGNIIFLNKLSAFRTVSPCFLVCSLLYPVEVIFPSKSPKKSLKKMFPFNFQLSGCNSGFFLPKRSAKFCSCFSVAMGDHRGLC